MCDEYITEDETWELIDGIRKDFGDLEEYLYGLDDAIVDGKYLKKYVTMFTEHSFR